MTRPAPRRTLDASCWTKPGDRVRCIGRRPRLPDLKNVAPRRLPSDRRKGIRSRTDEVTMATFKAKPQILIELHGASRATAESLGERIGEDATTRAWCAIFPDGQHVDSFLVDVDVAEKAVAWLKAHGVEQSK